MSGGAWVCFVHHVFSPPRLWYHQEQMKTIRGGVTLRAIKLPSCLFYIFVVRDLVLLPPPPNHNAILSLHQLTNQQANTTSSLITRSNGNNQINKSKQRRPLAIGLVRRVGRRPTVHGTMHGTIHAQWIEMEKTWTAGLSRQLATTYEV
jgi:hypothetical protein